MRAVLLVSLCVLIGAALAVEEIREVLAHDPWLLGLPVLALAGCAVLCRFRE